MSVDEARKALGCMIVTAAYTSACWAIAMLPDWMIILIMAGGVGAVLFTVYALFFED